jgi:threonylcarbamoyladenosine tRNA methylthiotransferase MtaB
MGFSKVHIFRFSKRPFTPAFYFDETVSEVLKKARALHLKEVAFAEQKLYKEHFLNKTVEVLVEGAEEGLLTGFTPYYLKVKFTGSAKTNEFVNVKIENVDANFMYGKEVI